MNIEFHVSCSLIFTLPSGKDVKTQAKDILTAIQTIGVRLQTLSCEDILTAKLAGRHLDTFNNRLPIADIYGMDSLIEPIRNIK